MVSAVLMLLVAGVGVGFGWQPMPDGSPAYEYVVQVEPEMLETLAEGQAVPIVSEVPPGLGPIARVRVVVGRGDVPRRLMVTQLKPATEATADGGVVLTQYTEPAGGRYATQPSAAPPNYGAPASGVPATGAYDPITQAPPATGGNWNYDAAATANPLRGAAAGTTPLAAPGGNWNADAPVARVAAGIQEATAPIADGFDRFGNRVRTATDNLGNRTGQLLEQVGHPLRTLGLRDGGTTPASTTTAAATGTGQPGAAYDPNTGSTAPPWNAGAEPYQPGASAMSAAGGAAPPAASWNAGASPGDAASQGNNWNQPAVAPNPGAIGATGGPATGSDAPPLIPGGTQFPATGSNPYGTSSVPPAGTAANADPWSNADDARLRSGGAGGVAAGGASQWPGTSPGAPGASVAGQGGAAMAGASGAATPPIGTRIPAIGSGMLQLPGDRALDGPVIPVAGTGSGNIFSPATTGASVFPVSQPPGAQVLSTGAGSATQNWLDTVNSTAQTAATQAKTTPASDARSKAAVIMAWVLLSGSAAGNIYLFWSYLDVRTKYRALVRKTARAVGSRFSPA